MTQNIVSNPFFRKFSGDITNDIPNSNEVHNEFNYLYFLCRDNKSNIDVELFYDQNSKLEDLVKQTVFLYRVNLNLIEYNDVKSCLIIVDKNILNYFNKANYELGDRELVYLMVDCAYSTLSKWYNSINVQNFDEYLELKIFSDYYNLGGSTKLNLLLSFVQKLTSASYWADTKNLSLANNEKFVNRKFNLKINYKWNLNSDTYDKKFSELLQQLPKNKESCYENLSTVSSTSDNIEKFNDDHLNIFKKQKKNFKSFYDTKINDTSINEYEVEYLLCNKKLSEKEMVYISCYLLLSKDFCHYIFKNVNILTSLSYIFEKYKPLYRYILSYTWQYLAKEEEILKSKITNKTRHVFTLEQASLLPVFYYNSYDSYKNSYYNLNVATKNIPINNLYGVDFPENLQKGLVDIGEFRKRLNIFVTGNANINLFENINWESCGVTGGCMSALIPKCNPLMFRSDNLNKTVENDITDNVLNTFFDNYYSSSDIDICFTNSTTEKFIENVNNFINNLKASIKKYFLKDDDSLVINGHKNLHIYINKKLLFLKCKRNEMPFTFDHIIKNLQDQKIRVYFYRLYLEQFNLNKANINCINDLHIKLMLPASYEDMTLTVSDNDLDWKNVEVSNIENIIYESVIFVRFNEIIKFKVTSPYIKHTIEMFKMNFNEKIACVAKFHLPCVRACYDGKTCYLLPSAITAYNCLTNTDFNYFVGTKDPLFILTKYRKRGYGTILNKHEILQYTAYICNDKDNFYNISQATQANAMYGYYSSSSDFFSKVKNTTAIIKSDQNNDSKKVVTWYLKKYPKICEPLMFNSIDNNGNIYPVKKWLIDAMYDLLNQ